MRSIDRPERLDSLDDMEVISNDGNLCGEGPLWDERADALYRTDITGRSSYRYLMKKEV